MSQFKLAIDDVVEVPVKFTIKVKGVDKLFAFSFTANRLDQDEISSRLDEKEKKTKDFMADLITGWSGQRLVLTASDEPADFSPEALEMMLNATGVATVLFNAYLKGCGAKEKN
ncbi:MAG: hypothetical protein ABI606_06290 [Rhodoferax sp.]